MSELPPQPRPESKKIILPHEFNDEEKRQFGGTSYHSYENYDERAGAQAEREYAAGDKGAEPTPVIPDYPPFPEDEPPTTKMDLPDPWTAPPVPEDWGSIPALEEDLDETTKMPEVEDGEETKEERRARIVSEIDEADRMKRPTKRMKALKDIAYYAQANGELGLAIDAASRIRTSKTRKKGGASQLWIRNTLAHDQVMRDLTENIDPDEIDDRLKAADRIKFGYKRNPVMAAIIGSVYKEAHESFEGGWEDDGQDLEKEAQKLTSEKLRGWRSPKYFGETITFWAILRNDPDALTALGGIRHFMKKRRAKKTINESLSKEE